MTKLLTEKVALITGASRGVGKGIALALGEAGATVYVTGRTTEEGKAAVPLPGTIHQTAEEVTALGGRGIAIRCDHANDDDVAAAISQIRNDVGRIDILVNNVWGGYEFYYDGTEFWKETGFWTIPISRWDAMFTSGVRAHYVASTLTAPLMIEQQSGLIVNISFEAAGNDAGGVAYSVSKSATDRMAACSANELKQYNVAAVSLYPGLVRTEAVMKVAEHFDLTKSQSPLFIGRAVCALATDANVMSKTGGVYVVADLAREYGFVDLPQ